MGLWCVTAVTPRLGCGAIVVVSMTNLVGGARVMRADVEWHHGGHRVVRAGNNLHGGGRKDVQQQHTEVQCSTLSVDGNVQGG
jgi:hypothetical protein